ncbi:MAG: hypothetical protein RMN51_04185 [Verrucomicrobiota bacterium]|nr:hypothetical protein [Limisphaera sp.]MDW8381294.1 hypothetical protein [Verrucomicrobiota bacterium]
MSLIHDALRRLQSQQSSGEARVPQEWLCQAISHARPGVPSWTLVGVGILLGAGVFLLWHGWRPGGTASQSAHVATSKGLTPSDLSCDPTAVALESPPSRSSISHVESAFPPAADLTPTNPARESPAIGGDPVSHPLAQVSSNEFVGSPAQDLNTPQTVQDPPTLKLQGILYHPDRPWAVLNHRTVTLGGRVAGWQIVRIAPDHVVVVGYGRTLVLELP